MATLGSPRFQGSTTLEKCLNGLRTMPPQNGTQPETDSAAVKMVQRALVDLGYLLSFDEVDGNFGNRTATAVSRFKADRGISPSDGVVGVRTSRALDDEFQPGTLGVGSFTSFVTAKRADQVVAGLLDKLNGLTALPWAKQTAVFALQELTNQNLVGIVRASRVADLKPLVPAVEHAAIDVVAARLTAALPDSGPLAIESSFDQAGWIRGHVIVRDAMLDRAQPGDARHLGMVLALSHELTHFRNRVLERGMRAEPISSANFVDVTTANAAQSASGDRTSDTRAIFVAEIGGRHLAWKVFQDLVVDHAASMLQAGVITRPQAVSELSTALTPGVLFRSALKLGTDGTQDQTVYSDNGYMDALLHGHGFNEQVARWMLTANQLTYHNEAARTAEVTSTLTNEFNAQSPGFASPTVRPAGLISA
jgi:peptidoglycan hydrolase-like protein with peptidoglycan-binding domain